MDSRNLQVFLRSPHLQISNRALTLNSNLTWAHLKTSLFNPNYPLPSFFSFNGKTLDDSSTIGSSGITPFSTVHLHFKIFGGGGDGGATGAESRDCYLNMYAEKKPDKVDPNEKRLSKWSTCALSFEPLKQPCVIDRLGNIFNKEAIVKALLAKSLPKPFSLYIKGLKDLIPINLHPSSSASGSFECPISGFDFNNGKYRFLALSKCGHVLSAKALKEVKSSSCLVCHREFDKDDKIPINGNDDEVDMLREKMILLKEREREMKTNDNNNNNNDKVKKKKKKKKDKSGEEDVQVQQLSGKKHAIVDVTANANGGANNKKFKAVDIAPPNANKKVYASIFTSSKKTKDFKETYSCRSLPLGRN